MTIEHVTKLTSFQQQSQTASSGLNMFGGNGIGFDDLIDMVNPLQHIPGVSQAYRAVTGDTISTGAAMIGGAIFGGFAGVVSSSVGALIEGINGESIASSVAQIVTDTDSNAALFASPALPALQPDNGEALLKLYANGAFSNEASAQQHTSPPPAPITQLGAYAIHQHDDAARLDPLNLNNGEKTQQMQADLHKTMLDTLS